MCGTDRPKSNLERFEAMQPAVERVGKRSFKALSIEVDIAAANAAYSPREGDMLREGLLTPQASAVRTAFRDASQHSINQSTFKLVNAVAANDLAGVRELLKDARHSVNPRPAPDSLIVHESYVSGISSASPSVSGGENTAQTLVGPPSVFHSNENYGPMLAGTWVPALEDPTAVLVFTTDSPMYVDKVEVYETYQVGAVTKLEAWDGYEFVTIWEGAREIIPKRAARVFAPDLQMFPSFTSQRFRMHVDLTKGPTAIDAIKVVGSILKPSLERGRLGFDIWQRSPLMVACKNGNVAIASFLLGAGADPTRKSMFGYNSLDWVIHNVGKGGTVDGVQPGTISSSTPRAGASSGGGAFSFSAPDGSSSGKGKEEADGPVVGSGAFSFDVGTGEHMNLLYLLLSRQDVHAPYLADPQYQRNSLGETILHYCVEHELVDVLKVLTVFRSTSFPWEMNTVGITPLDMSMEDEVRAVFDDAEAKLADVANNGVSGTLIDVILREPFNGYELQDGLARGLFPENTINRAVGDKGTTPLIAAARTKNTLAATIMMLHQGNPLTLDSYGNCALSYAAMNGMVDMVTMFLSKTTVRDRLAVPASPPDSTVDPTTIPNTGEAHGWRNANGDTFLHAAVRGGRPEIARFFLGFEWSWVWVTAENNQGQRPVDLIPPGADAMLAAFNEANYKATKMTGAETPRPFSARGEPAICAVCFMPSPGGEPAFECECRACVCVECFSHLARTAVMSGKIVQCCNLRCSMPVNLGVLRKFLSIKEVLSVVALSINEDIPVERAFKHVCTVCERANNIEPVLGGDTPRFACDHCGVSTCVVCTQVYPMTTDVGEDVAALDQGIHAPCENKFKGLKQFAALNDVLSSVGIRHCPECNVAGLKDDRCCHIHCSTSGCGDYCYPCGRKDFTSGSGSSVSVGTHSCYDGPWPEDPSWCMMYLHHLARVDPRVAELGCKQPDCRPRGNCPNDSVCRNQRDLYVSALFSTIRCRCAVLHMMREMGKAEFIEMVDKFNFRGMTDHLYFNDSFPWDGDEIPLWYSFEPEEVQDWYAQRLRWFVLPELLEDYKRLAGEECDKYPAGNSNDGGGGIVTT